MTILKTFPVHVAEPELRRLIPCHERHTGDPYAAGLVITLPLVRKSCNTYTAHGELWDFSGLAPENVPQPPIALLTPTQLCSGSQSTDCVQNPSFRVLRTQK